MSDRQMIIEIDDCERGRHEFQPRHDFEKIGTIVKQTYVCDVCRICGHQVLPPLTVRCQLEAGVVTKEEVREAIRLRCMVGHSSVTLEQALAVVVERGLVPSADSKQRTSEAP